MGAIHLMQNIFLIDKFSRSLCLSSAKFEHIPRQFGFVGKLVVIEIGFHLGRGCLPPFDLLLGPFDRIIVELVVICLATKRCLPIGAEFQLFLKLFIKPCVDAFGLCRRAFDRGDRRAQHIASCERDRGKQQGGKFRFHGSPRKLE